MQGLWQTIKGYLTKMAVGAGIGGKRGGGSSFQSYVCWQRAARAGQPRPYGKVQGGRVEDGCSTPQGMRRMQSRTLCIASLGLGLLLAFCITTTVQSQLAFAATCAEVRSDTLRLHIVANSNSVADQVVKLQVRDAILAEMAAIYQESAQDTALTQAESVALSMQNIPRLALAASAALSNAGVQQTVHLSVEQRYFATTQYASYTLPAGQYTALCITLGAAKGRNWWCVLYPSICLASAGATYESPAETEVICGDYALRFAALEWWQKQNGTS